MNKKKLNGLVTDVWLRNLKVAPGKSGEYFKEQNGFTVRVLASGVITFLFIYDWNGKRRQMNLGRYPSTSLAFARQKHDAAFKLYSAGIDPTAEAEPPPPPPEVTTVSKVASDFLESWSAVNYSSRWHQNVKAALETDVLPFIGTRDITTVRRKDIVEILERVVKRAPGQARNVCKAISKMMWFACKVREHIDVSPCTDMLDIIPSLRVPEGKKRNLSDAEIKKFWKRIDRYAGSDSVKRALKFVLVTGQRPEEVVEMHSREISVEGEDVWWTITWQRIKTENSKTLKRAPMDHRVYLTPLALSLVDGRKGFIFPSPRSKKAIEQNKPVQPIRRNSLSQRVERPDTISNKSHKFTFQYYGLREWGPHDLRRTVRTGMARLGVQDRHAEEVINHKQPKLTKTYDIHAYDKEKKAAMLRWERHLKRVLIHVLEAT